MSLGPLCTLTFSMHSSIVLKGKASADEKRRATVRSTARNWNMKGIPFLFLNIAVNFNIQ